MRTAPARQTTGFATVVSIYLLTVSAQAQDDDPLANWEPPLSALAPENINAERPPAPFDLTGTWFVDLDATPSSWRFGPPYPQFTPAAQAHIDASQAAIEEGKVYRDDIGQCWPAGMPLIMTRVWPIAMIQLPTAIYMISGFMNSMRVVYLDGREHSPADLVVRSFNGQSIGTWEGDTLVVDTVGFAPGVLAAPVKHSEQLHIVERYTLRTDPLALHREFEAVDPVYFTDTYAGSDTVLVADVPYVAHPCDELAFEFAPDAAP